MGWEILWPLILGFLLSATVQAVVSHSEMSRLLPDDSPLERSVQPFCECHAHGMNDRLDHAFSPQRGRALPSYMNVIGFRSRM
jgi:hypothetical protein